jgi:hypothetical protein
LFFIIVVYNGVRIRRAADVSMIIHPFADCMAPEPSSLLPHCIFNGPVLPQASIRDTAMQFWNGSL